MKKLIFQGYLKDLYPEGIEVEANSAAEAIGLLSNFPGLRPEDNVRHVVTCPQFGTPDALRATTDIEVIEIVPFNMVGEDFEGSGGKGGLLQIIIGVILIVFSAGIAGVIGLGLTAGQVVMAGAMMVLGGLLQMIMPAPSTSSDNKNEKKSNYIAANKNTVQIGTTIPILVGERKVFGHFLSFNVTATNLNDPPPTAATGTGAAVQGANGAPLTYVGEWEDGKGP